MFNSALLPLSSVDAPQHQGQAMHKLRCSSFLSHCDSTTRPDQTDCFKAGLLPAINADKLQVLLGVAQILFSIPFLHDRFECVFIVTTYC